MNLCCVQVVTSNGNQALSSCFLQSKEIGSLAELLKQLQLPFLDIPDPQASHWSFLAQCGVSVSLQWPDLLRILGQLSSSNASPPVSSMQKLYGVVEGRLALDPSLAADVTAAFADQRLIYVPPAGTEQGAGRWLTSKDVLWSGSRKILPTVTFIKRSYQVSHNCGNAFCVHYLLVASKVLLIACSAY